MPSPDLSAARVVELACRAPSIHNSQPWRWRVDGHRIELHADRGRQLVVADPHGRMLLLSCGAALDHARVAATSLGYDPVVTRHPDPGQPDLLATLELVDTERAPEFDEELHVLLARRTDRRRFTSWPVPAEHLQALARSVATPDVQVVPLTGTADRVRAGVLVSQAASTQDGDPAFVDEARRWTSRHRPTVLAAPDGIIAICTVTDGQAAWVAAGEALSELWLHAAHDGLSVVPLSQVVEVEATRRVLHHEILGGLVHPQVVLRLGWQEIGRGDLPPTPRRPLPEVLESASG